MHTTLDSIHLTHIIIPLHEPFVISSGAVASKDAILVEIRADTGVGCGEASPMAGVFYSSQTPESTWSVLTRELVPRLAGCKHIALDGKWTHGFSDDPFAINGLDVALWDLAARVQGRPLWQFIGGEARDIESGLAVGIYDDTRTLLERIESHLRQSGYRRIKIKIQPGWDEAPLAAVRQRWPAMPLMVDANCAYTREHLDHLARLDRFDLMMIEQPLPRGDLAGHAALARRCRTPICLDESAESPQAVRRAIESGSAAIINIKLQRLGTLAAALEVHALAARAGVGCWMGTMPELAVGSWAAIHFATLANMCFPTDVEASARWFVADVTRPPVTCSGGLLRLPSEPGLGVELDGEVIERYKVREWSGRLGGRLDAVTPEMK